jgi:hypothetical protein
LLHIELDEIRAAKMRAVYQTSGLLETHPGEAVRGRTLRHHLEWLDSADRNVPVAFPRASLALCVRG